MRSSIAAKSGEISFQRRATATPHGLACLMIAPRSLCINYNQLEGRVGALKLLYDSLCPGAA
jgi:hypothetical protein